MGKGNLRSAVLFGPSGGRQQRCIGCKQRILYGERCETCKRALIKRKRRKPR
jgi:hypothetical protein